MTKVNAKLQQCNPGKTTNGPDNSGIKVWVIPPDKETGQAEINRKRLVHFWLYSGQLFHVRLTYDLVNVLIWRLSMG